jgi:NRAMP (natural resistance-associated macrophage protein)-like metal ion transporter
MPEPAPAAARHKPGNEPRIHRDRPPDPTVRKVARESNPVKRPISILGSGLITGASDDDPSGIGTYAQAGARYGYAMLWTTLAMLPMISAVEYICAKIGLVSGRGLAGALRLHYPRAILYPTVLAMIVANTINAGADIGAIAAALNLLAPIPTVALVIPVSGAILALQVFGSYRLIERVFRWLALALLAYVGAAFFAHPNVPEVLAGTLIPTIRLDAQFIGMLVALLGTTISPYLFFWQASQEVEQEMEIGRKRLWQRQGASKTELKYALWDTLTGMIFAEAVAYFIILATGATLFAHGQTNIGSAVEAAQALRPVAGDASAVLLAIGLIGAGVLAVPILTGSAAYGVSEAFGWKFGLDRPPTAAPQFYGVIVAATVVGVAINFLGINPIDALVISSVINGLLAPPLLVLVMIVSNDRKVMGRRTNGRLLNMLGWATTGVMAAAALALVVTTLLG